MSLYIRTKDIDKDGNISCYTCNKKLHYTEAQCGHFIHNKIDMAMNNLKPQCQYCNKWLHGNLANYAIHLIEDNGIEWVKDLRDYANEKCNKYSLEELQIIHDQLRAVLVVNHQKWVYQQEK